MGDRQAGQQASERPSEQAGEQSGERAGPESQWRRRARLAAVFGDVLPETTSDERGDDATSDHDAGDRWLRGQVPPHHG